MSRAVLLPRIEVSSKETGGRVNTAKSAWPALLALAGAFLVPAAAAAGQQQASFAVAVTLHRVVKPLSAAELCKDGRPIQTLGATIQIDCPRPVGRTGAAGSEASLRDGKAPRPEVTVTF